MNEKLNKLERQVIQAYLEILSPKGWASEKSLDNIRVRKREYTGCGYFTNLERTPESLIQDSSQDYTGGDVLVTLNKKTLVGHLFFIKEGHLDCIEGYTFGEDWPEVIEDIEIGEVER